MTTLLEETNRAISSNGHSMLDIEFIGSITTGHRCHVWDFAKLADKEYEAVATDLVIIFCNGARLEREQAFCYGEGWVYFPSVTIPKETKVIDTLFSTEGWCTLEELNSEHS